MQKRAVFYVYILRAIRAGRCRERRYADHIFIQIYFRMHHFVVKFSKFSSPQTQGGIDPLTKILRRSWPRPWCTVYIQPLHFCNRHLADTARHCGRLRRDRSVCDLCLRQTIHAGHIGASGLSALVFTQCMFCLITPFAIRLLWPGNVVTDYFFALWDFLRLRLGRTWTLGVINCRTSTVASTVNLVQATTNGC